jgi:mercuric ion transport protein
MVAISGIDQPPSKSGHGALYAGGTAAILASTCHHISYLLVTLGLSNTKIVYIVTLADWARPFLVTVAIIALYFSYRHIWHVSSDYKAGSTDTASQANITDKVFFVFIAMLVIVVLMLPHFLPCTE